LLHARSGGHRVPLAPSRRAPKTRKETMNGVWRSPVLKPKSATRSGQRITTNTPNIISDRCAGTKNRRKTVMAACRQGAGSDQLRSVGRHVGRDPPRLILGEQLSRRTPPRFVLEIDIGERLSVVVAHDKSSGLFPDGPRRREAAGHPTAVGHLAYFHIPIDVFQTNSSQNYPELLRKS
jgi:hypothetical protein